MAIEEESREVWENKVPAVLKVKCKDDEERQQNAINEKKMEEGKQSQRGANDGQANDA